MRFKLLVEIELDAINEDAAMDLPHVIWTAGDPADATNAMLWVKDLDPMPEVER